MRQSRDHAGMVTLSWAERIVSAMLTMIAGRIGHTALTLLAMSLVVFIGTNLLPGDVADALLGQAATPEATAALRGALHLNEPAALRYLHWLGGLLTGDAGRSLVSQIPVTELIGSRLGNSLLLAALTAAVAVPTALLLGLAAAVWRDTVFDRLTTIGSIAAISVPDFLVATVAVKLAP